MISPYVYPILNTNLKKYIHPEVVASVICKYFDLTIDEIREKTKKSKIIIARHFLAYFLSKKFKSMSLGDIAKYIGLTNHTTIIFIKKKIDNFIDNKDEKYYQHYLNLKKKLG